MRKNESKPVLETARLFLREMTEADLDDLKEILQDEKVMTAYEGAFSEKEVRDWLSRQQNDIENRATRSDCGRSSTSKRARCSASAGRPSKTGTAKPCWKSGTCSKGNTGSMDTPSRRRRRAKRTCSTYSIKNAVYSIIRDTNRNSQNVAKRNGMDIVDHWTKHYRGVDMPHDLWRAEKRVCDEVFLWYSENEK